MTKLIAPSYLLLLLIGSSFLATVFAHLEGDKDKKRDDVNHKDHKVEIPNHKNQKDHKHDDNKNQKHDYDHKNDDHNKDQGNRGHGDHKNNEHKGNDGDHKNRDRDDDHKIQKHNDDQKHHSNQTDHKQDSDHKDKHNDDYHDNKQNDNRRSYKYDDDRRGYKDKADHGGYKQEDVNNRHGNSDHGGHQGHPSNHRDYNYDGGHKDYRHNDDRRGYKHDDDYRDNEHDYHQMDHDSRSHRDNDAHRHQTHNDHGRHEHDDNYKGYKHYDDHKDNEQSGRGNHKDHRGHKDENQIKEETKQEILTYLNKFKREMLEKCKKDDHPKDTNHSHGESDGERKHHKDNEKGKFDQKPEKQFHHYHHYHPDGNTKTCSTHKPDGSNNHQQANHEHHHQHGSEDDRVGQYHSHSYDHNSRNHRQEQTYDERTEVKSYEQRHSGAGIVHHHHVIGEWNGDTVHLHPQNTHYPDSQHHGEHKNEHCGWRNEPRQSSCQGDYDHSHPNYEQHYPHTAGACAKGDIRVQPAREITHCGCREDTLTIQPHSHGCGIERTLCDSRQDTLSSQGQGCEIPCRNHNNCGSESHTAGHTQGHQNCHAFVTGVTCSLPENCQHKQESAPCKDTYQHPKTCQCTVAHVCHHHDHVVRVEEPNCQIQQQYVDASNSFSHQSELKFPMDIASIWNLPSAQLVSACIGVEQHQPTSVCQELKTPNQPCCEPKEDKPVVLICVQKKLDTPCESPKVIPPPCPPPRTEPPCQPLRVDPPHCLPPQREQPCEPLQVDPPYCPPPRRQPQYSIQIREASQHTHEPHQPQQHCFQCSC